MFWKTNLGCLSQIALNNMQLLVLTGSQSIIIKIVCKCEAIYVASGCLKKASHF